MTTTMQWERAEEAQIDPRSFYVVQTNGGEWRDLDLYVLKGAIVQSHLKPEHVRGRPVWVAKIIRPEASS
jgi:hypothetical protein